MDETKIFGVEGIKFAGMVKGSGSNDHIGYARSVAERVGSVSEGKDVSKTISSQNFLSFKSVGKEGEVVFFITSFTTTSTCLPNKYSGNAMVWSFSVGTIIWRYINLRLSDYISKIRK